MRFKYFITSNLNILIKDTRLLQYIHNETMYVSIATVDDKFCHDYLLEIYFQSEYKISYNFNI